MYLILCGTLSKDLAVPARRHKFTLIGTPQDKTFVDPSNMDPKLLPDVMDDFDVSCTLELDFLLSKC
jgi:hypothetical protein